MKLLSSVGFGGVGVGGPAVSMHLCLSWTHKAFHQAFYLIQKHGNSSSYQDTIP